MQTSSILDIASKAMGKDYVCNRCLGRLFAKLIHGITNEERGKIVRGMIALMIETGKEFEIHGSNFQEYSLRKMSFPHTSTVHVLYAMTFSIP